MNWKILKRFPFLLLLLVSLVVSVVVVLKQTNSRQFASSISQLEPENGVLAGEVSVISDQNASGGKAVQLTTGYTLKPTCTDLLQTQITNTASGGTLKVRTDCIYRETMILSKPIILDGQGRAEIRGSDVWGDNVWTQQNGYWISSNTIPPFSWANYGDCEGGLTDAQCHWPEQVFINGQPLTQVATNSAVTSNQFKLSPTRQIILSDNPLSKSVEVTIRPYWINVPFNTAISNVTIQGFTMKHAATPVQEGGIRLANTSNNWTIQNNTLSDAHGKMIIIGCTSSLDSGGSGHKILNNILFHGGDAGMGGCNFFNTLIQGNTIFDNNTEHFATGWEAGGIKIASNPHDVTIDNNEVYNNRGPGLWCDGNCNNITYSNNRIHDNTTPGISQEISNRAIIFNNKIWNNGWGFSAWGFGSGILLQNTSNSEVYNNIVAWSGDGIAVEEQNRSDYNYAFAQVHDDYIHDNTIIKAEDLSDPNDMSLAWLSDWKQPDGTYQLFSSTANNRGSNNMYWYTIPEATTHIRFGWNGGIKLLSSFNATPGEENGRYLSDAEKNAALQNAGIPLAPPPH